MQKSKTKLIIWAILINQHYLVSLQLANYSLSLLMDEGNHEDKYIFIFIVY